MKSPSRRCIFTLSLGALLLALLVALLIAVEALLRIGRTADVSLSDIIDVKQPSDYILDRNWDVTARPQLREFHWTVRDHVHNPDGVYRPMILVNNQFPGPLVEANEGDTIRVIVDNRAINATSIHWHGIYQRGTPHMDGTIGVTQCESERFVVRRLWKYTLIFAIQVRFLQVVILRMSLPSLAKATLTGGMLITGSNHLMLFMALW